MMILEEFDVVVNSHADSLRGTLVKRLRLQKMPPRWKLAPFLELVRAQAVRNNRKLDTTRKYLVYSLDADGRDHPSYYIGKGLKKRPEVHFDDSRLRESSHKNHIIKKALRESRTLYIDILYDRLDEETSLALEMFLINHFGREDLGTGCLANQTNGGDGASGYVPSDATRRLMSISHTGLSHSSASKIKIGEANRQRKWSKASRAKVSAKHSGKVNSDETRCKISASNRGQKRSAEAKANMSRAQTGRVVSDETRSKIRAARTLPDSVFNARLAWHNPLFVLVERYVGTQTSLFRCRYCSGEQVYKDVPMLNGSLPKEHYHCGNDTYSLELDTRVYGRRRNPHLKAVSRLRVPGPKGVNFTFSLRSAGVIFFDQDGAELYRMRLPQSYIHARLSGEQKLLGIQDGISAR